MYTISVTVCRKYQSIKNYLVDYSETGEMPFGSVGEWNVCAKFEYLWVTWSQWLLEERKSFSCVMKGRLWSSPLRNLTDWTIVVCNNTIVQINNNNNHKSNRDKKLWLVFKTQQFFWHSWNMFPATVSPTVFLKLEISISNIWRKGVG
jgi:hypothetical protein